jgi:cell division protein FtsN
MPINDARTRRGTGGAAPLGQRLALAMAGLAVLGLTFALGVLVGRQWSRPQPSLAQVSRPEAEPAAERRPQTRRSALVESAAERAREGGERLTFYQTLTAPLGVSATAPEARARAEAPARPEHARADLPPRPDAVARTEAAARPENPGREAGPRVASSPAPAPPARPAPATAPEPSAWTVQVGAFKERAPAEALQRQLAGAGLDARLADVPPTEGQPRYRVRVGKYGSKVDAQRAAERLRHERALATFVAAAP